MSFDLDDPRLTAFALGELEGPDRLEIEALLAERPEVAQAVAEIRRTAALLTDALRDEPTPGLSIVQKLELNAQFVGRRRWPVRRLLWAVAAALLFAIAGFGLGRFSGEKAPLNVADSTPAAPAVAGREISRPEELLLRDSSVELKESIRPGTYQALSTRNDSETLVPEDFDTSRLAEDSVSLGVSQSADSVDEAAIQEENVAEAVAESRLDRMNLADAEGGLGGGGGALGQGALGQRVTPQALAARPPSREALENARGRTEAFGGVRTERPLKEPLKTSEPPASSSSSEDLVTRNLELPSPSNPSEVAALGLAEDSNAAFFAGPTVKAKTETDLEVSSRLSTFAGSRQEVVSPDRTRKAELAAANLVELQEFPQLRQQQQQQELEQVQELGRRQVQVAGAPILSLDFNQSGDRLAVTQADNSVSVLDVERGVALNKLQVAAGPPPDARLDTGDRLILNNFATKADQGTPSFEDPEDEPLINVPVGLGRLPIEELGEAISDGQVPLGSGFPIAELINTPPYLDDEPVDDEAPIALHVSNYLNPWAVERQLVRVALKAVSRTEDDPSRIVAEDVRLSVVFNPLRVAGYNLIGIDDVVSLPLPTLPAPAEAADFATGDSLVVLLDLKLADVNELELEPEDGFFKNRYQAGPAVSNELLTVGLSYTKPGASGRTRIESSVGSDAPRPLDASSNDVWLTIALARLGLTLRGPQESRPEGLSEATRFIQSCDESYLPSIQSALLNVINQVGQVNASHAPAAQLRQNP